MSIDDAVTLLLVENEECDIRRIRKTLELRRDRILVADTVHDAPAAIDQVTRHPAHYDVVVLDDRAMAGISKELFISRIREVDPTLQVIILQEPSLAHGEGRRQEELGNGGAFWYCTKYPGPREQFIYQPTDFLLSILNASDRRRLEKKKLQGEQFMRRNIEKLLEEKKLIGESAPMVRLRAESERQAQCDGPVLIVGEIGTGKELAAWNIHLRSSRRYEEFVRIVCPVDSADSLLRDGSGGTALGERGSGGGTLFVKEVADLMPEVQQAIVQETRLGGRRLIASTKRNLKAEAEAGHFSHELWEELSCATVSVPPLRQRGEDVLLLFEHFLQLLSRELNVVIPTVEPGIETILQNYRWPKNVHELRSLAYRLLFASGGVITMNVVNGLLFGKREESTPVILPFGGIGQGEVVPLREMEHRFRSWYFSYVKGVSTSDASAARKLGLAPPNFYRMCKKLGMK